MKKVLKILCVIVGIPLLVLFLIAIGNHIILYLYCKLQNIDVSTLSRNQLMNIVRYYMYIGSAIGEFLSVIVLFIIYFPTKEGLIKRCKFKKYSSQKLRVVLFLLLGFAVLTIVYIHLTQGIFESYVKVENNVNLGHQSFWGFLLSIFLIPVFEEIIFRGVMLGTFKKSMNLKVAVVLQALIFAIMHGNIIQSSYTFFLGIILGVAFLYTGSIFGDIICHITFNLFGLLIIPIIEHFYYNNIVYILIGFVLIIFSFILYKHNRKGVTKL